MLRRSFITGLFMAPAIIPSANLMGLSSRLLRTPPIVSADESYGYLPGSIAEKRRHLSLRLSKPK